MKESPFVERLLKKGYEVLYLTEAVDEYAISALPEFEGKKFQNVAKEGVEIDGDRYVLIFIVYIFIPVYNFYLFFRENPTARQLNKERKDLKKGSIP